MSVFYEMAIPLSFLYFKDKRLITQICYYLPVFISFIFLFSAAGFVALPIAIIIVTLLSIRSQRSFATLIVIGLIIAAIFSSDVTRYYLDQTVGSRLEIFSDTSEQRNFSAMDRRSRYEDSFELFLSAPLGIGWGMPSQLALDSQQFAGVQLKEAGLISLYAEILVASGIGGLFLFLRFIGKKMVRLAKLASLESRLVLVSVLSISLHYIFISNYWFPMLWFSLVLADIVTIENKKPTS
ncbi:MAG: O-antigen ligase family protein [Richelia sp. RM2_1_2]|nr:O-antigen ligase family protein [Richelia sp. RM2_1_2]